MRPDDLAATVVKALVARTPTSIRDASTTCYFGDANAAGEDNRNVARMAMLLAGLPTSIPGATVNRLCGSGMEAAIDASREIAVGDASICIAGGVESMSARAVGAPEAGRAVSAHATSSSTRRRSAGGW